MPLLRELFICSFGFSQRYEVLPRASFLNCFVYGDSRQPGGETRFFSELVEMPESLDEGVLHRFFGVLDVSENSERHTEDAAFILSYDWLDASPAPQPPPVHHS